MYPFSLIFKGENMNTKNEVIAILEQNRGVPISGTQIAKSLNISRNAVWKTINLLKNEGYSIDAVSNRGYTLALDNDILSLAGIIPYLADETVAKKTHIHKSLKSTNKTAKELAIAGAEHGTVIIADTQTAGKGRYDKHFFSPPKGGLYTSIILRASDFDLTNTTHITKTAAVAVCKSVENLAKVEPKIKPVNDIFLNGKKICGILTEAISDLESGNIEWAVVGIGINVSITDFPSELENIATSIFAENPQNIDAPFRSRLAAELINFFLTDKKTEIDIESEYEKRILSTC